MLVSRLDKKITLVSRLTTAGMSCMTCMAGRLLLQHGVLRSPCTARSSSTIKAIAQTSGHRIRFSIRTSLQPALSVATKFEQRKRLLTKPSLAAAMLRQVRS